ncbi:MAG TPA: tRNA (N6-threonylcarbamoyladenosine(37)-N6)-methyltransferase TrmO [Spirochaetota bacterium]|nr:tRNA (N6-threonylcarbamoyladenosine(37)-N6)-methyltransferase TrmO [Spirochaetota bacterium]HPI89714.1 tRNA (N6-threonylcarbamoyladenosine(37)-N6)-methyltransferase TrmO [Spirochaetota bacterium]HPR48327.1 tRNA (N6-threonylcarbamoyladenosine(37)-N6)-methyltransferase TrmO [Spirochaetota bacterium]
MNEIVLKPIGIIHTPFTKREGMPIQAAAARGVKGSIEVDQEFAPGLKDLQGFSHIILLYHFHRSEGYSLEVVPFMDTEVRGVFSTRAPRRPNPIGLSIVRLTGIKENMLEVEDVDMIDGTPLLDIKPYVPAIDDREVSGTGWLDGKKEIMNSRKSDGRFK